MFCYEESLPNLPLAMSLILPLLANPFWPFSPLRLQSLSQALGIHSLSEGEGHFAPINYRSHNSSGASLPLTSSSPALPTTSSLLHHSPNIWKGDDVKRWWFLVMLLQNAMLSTSLLKMQGYNTKSHCKCRTQHAKAVFVTARKNGICITSHGESVCQKDISFSWYQSENAKI